MSVTIRDVAKKAGVSVATVSRVLNGTAKVSDEARDAVIKAQMELGFYLNANARTLAKKDSQTIGILVSDISDAYFASMIKACDVAATAMGKSLLITQGFYDANREKKAIDSLISHQCSGLIVHALAIDDENLVNYMNKFPYIILVNRILKGYEDRCVYIDNEKGMYDEITYLISQGHRKIAYINSSFDIMDAHQRLSGYKRALNDHGISIDESLILNVPPSLEGGAAAAAKLLEIGTDRFTAIACYSDTIAASAMSIFENRGISVPEEVSFTGFDDLFLSSCLSPALTTVKNPIEKMGQMALELSIKRYAGNTEAMAENFQTELVVRKSVKKLV
ncbi:MAG: LacI family DNA-binding transcriptional regulator [Succinivibrio sp.]